MESLDEYMAFYSELFQEPASKLVLTIFLPLAFFAMLGLLWSISFFLLLIVSIVAIRFYYSLSKKTVLAGVLLVGIAWALNLIFNFSGITLFILLVVAIFGVYYGQDLADEKFSLTENLILLLVGPLWLLGPRRLKQFDLY